jgi:hypothetical protein
MRPHDDSQAHCTGRQLVLAAWGKPVQAADGKLPIPDATSRPPNLALILCNHLGYGDIGCFGSTKHRTPQIDRMAAEGMRLTSFYSTSAVCTPSRAALTPRLPARHSKAGRPTDLGVRAHNTLLELVHEEKIRRKRLGAS